jgi:HEAT repeat protein
MRQLGDYVRDYVGQLAGPRADDAWHSLVEAGPSGLPYVVEAFRATPDTGIRVSLIEVVGQYRSSEAVPFLAGLLYDRDPEIWKAALDSLVTIGGPAVRDALAAAEMAATEERRAWIAEAIQQVTAAL